MVTRTDLAGQGRQPHQIEVCLVPLDGTEFAQLALVVAKELAERLDVRIEIIRRGGSRGRRSGPA